MKLLPSQDKFCVHHTNMHQFTVSLYSMPHCIHVGCMWQCVFSCNVPPALLAEWPASFTGYCGNTGGNRYWNKSQHRKLTLKKKISSTAPASPLLYHWATLLPDGGRIPNHHGADQKSHLTLEVVGHSRILLWPRLTIFQSKLEFWYAESKLGSTFQFNYSHCQYNTWLTLHSTNRMWLITKNLASKTININNT